MLSKKITFFLFLFVSIKSFSANQIDYQDRANEFGLEVDNLYPNYRNLLQERTSFSNYATDFCPKDIENSNRFADKISFYINEFLEPSLQHIDGIKSYFNISKPANQLEPVGFLSHPLCDVNTESLTHTLGSTKVPKSADIARMQKFNRQMNEWRLQAIAGDDVARKNLYNLWGRFFSCLAYAESLTTADTQKSQSVADKYAPKGYVRPRGVEFYEDPLQSLESRLNIGLFQFTPNARGNLSPCIAEWNARNPSCAISASSTQGTVIKIVGSGYQTFNAFCGVNKILQTFAIQVNTTNIKSTHLANKTLVGDLKSPKNRCVTPFISAGKGYNHFGPLQNSLKTNLGPFIKCVVPK